MATVRYESDILGRGGVTQEVDHLAGRDLLGVEEVVDTHVDKDLLVVRLEVFVVINAGDRLLRAELFGEHRGDDVVVLLVVHGDKEVALAHGGTPQDGHGGRITLDGDHIGQVGNLLQELRVAVHHRNIVVVTTQHARQMATHLASTCNNDLHSFNGLLFAFLQGLPTPFGRSMATFLHFN